MLIFNCPNCETLVKVKSLAEIRTEKCKCTSCECTILLKKDGFSHMIFEVLSGGLLYFFAFVVLVSLPFLIPKSIISFGWSFAISSVLAGLILYGFEKGKEYFNLKYRITYKH